MRRYSQIGPPSVQHPIEDLMEHPVAIILGLRVAQPGDWPQVEV